MSQASNTILVTTNKGVSGAIAEAFGDEPLLQSPIVVEHLRELEKHLEHSPAGLVLVDVEPEPHVMLEYVRELVDANPQCRFVVIAPDFDKEILLESMQAGARHFLPQAWIGPDVVPICRELAEQVRGPLAAHGSLYTVLSASGGCGATTFAVNLAAELGAMAGQRSLLVDFDSRFGGVATHLGVHGEYGIADLLSREGGIDSELVRSTAVERGKWLDLLLSPVSINYQDPALLYLDGLEDAVNVFRSGYEATVIDAPSLTFEATAALAGLSTATVLVMQLNVKDLHNARLMLLALAEADVESPVHVVANRCKGAGKPVTLKEAAETLEYDGKVVPILDDPPSALRALNSGESVLEACPGSKLQKQMQHFARTLRGDDQTETSERKPKRNKKAA